jgi:hypothetical protein
MEEHTEQHLDKLSKKVIQSSVLETPTVDFTASLMSIIETISIESPMVHKPLISKLGWVAIVVIVTGIVGYAMYGTTEQMTLLSYIDYSFISNNRITEAISGIAISKIFMYAIVFFGVAWCIQIPMMTHYFDKRLEY